MVSSQIENIFDYAATAATAAMKSNQTGGGVKSRSQIERQKKVSARRKIVYHKQQMAREQQMAWDAMVSANIAQQKAEMKARRAAKATDERMGSSSWNAAVNEMSAALPTLSSSALAEKAIRDAAVLRQNQRKFLTNMVEAATKKAQTETRDIAGYKRKTSKKYRKHHSSRKKHRKPRTRRR